MFDTLPYVIQTTLFALPLYNCSTLNGKRYIERNSAFIFVISNCHLNLYSNEIKFEPQINFHFPLFFPLIKHSRILHAASISIHKNNTIIIQIHHKINTKSLLTTTTKNARKSSSEASLCFVAKEKL